MMEDNTVFEFVLHIMEASIVIGIAVVVWYLKTQQKKSNDESQRINNHNENSGPDRRWC